MGQVIFNCKKDLQNILVAVAGLTTVGAPDGESGIPILFIVKKNACTAVCSTGGVAVRAIIKDVSECKPGRFCVTHKVLSQIKFRQEHVKFVFDDSSIKFSSGRTHGTLAASDIPTMDDTDFAPDIKLHTVDGTVLTKCLRSVWFRVESKDPIGIHLEGTGTYVTATSNDAYKAMCSKIAAPSDGAFSIEFPHPVANYCTRSLRGALKGAVKIGADPTRVKIVTSTITAVCPSFQTLPVLDMAAFYKEHVKPNVICSCTVPFQDLQNVLMDTSSILSGVTGVKRIFFVSDGERMVSSATAPTGSVSIALNATEIKGKVKACLSPNYLQEMVMLSKFTLTSEKTDDVNVVLKFTEGSVAVELSDVFVGVFQLQQQ